jgi:hypothetical protein
MTSEREPPATPARIAAERWADRQFAIDDPKYNRMSYEERWAHMLRAAGPEGRKRLLQRFEFDDRRQKRGPP